MTYARDAIPRAQAARIAQRRPGIDPSTLVPLGAAALREMLQRYIDVGFSKFVLRPAEPPASWPEMVDRLADDVLSLQT